MSDNNYALSRLITAREMQNTAAYIAVNKKDPIWKQLAKLLDVEAQSIIHDSLNSLKS